MMLPPDTTHPGYANAPPCSCAVLGKNVRECRYRDAACPRLPSDDLTALNVLPFKRRAAAAVPDGDDHPAFVRILVNSPQVERDRATLETMLAALSEMRQRYMKPVPGETAAASGLRRTFSNCLLGAAEALEFSEALLTAEQEAPAAASFEKEPA